MSPPRKEGRTERRKLPIIGGLSDAAGNISLRIKDKTEFSRISVILKAIISPEENANEIAMSSKKRVYVGRIRTKT